MQVVVANPVKVVTDHTFAFTGGTSFSVTTEGDERVTETTQHFELTLRSTNAEGAVTVQSTRIFKTHLTCYNRVARPVVVYPEGHSPVELAIKEQDERNQRRLANKRTPTKE
jgi:hypothetical protein